ncbi:MAG: helix-turn-helix domain-containing protein [Deltaproteobacteria bacterium]|nr:helix-turn-helix domain-containing protein [Deltaproteobacteria bacterium]
MQEALCIELDPNLRAELELIIKTGPPQLGRRVQIILARADGVSLNAIGGRVGMHRDSVRRWVLRFNHRGLAGLQHGNKGKPRNVIFNAATRAEIRRRADTNPLGLGEPFARWSLCKLRDHLVERGIVRTISVETLRLMLLSEPLSKVFWTPRQRVIEPLPPEVRHHLLASAYHADPQQSKRARALLALANGATISDVVATQRIGKSHLRRWLADFRHFGLAALNPHGPTPPVGDTGRELNTPASSSGLARTAAA